MSPPVSSPRFGRSGGRKVNVVGKVMAWLGTDIKANGLLRNLPLSGARVQVQGGNVGFTDAQGNFSIPHTGTARVSVTVSFSNALRVGTLATGSGTLMGATRQLTPGVSQTIQIYSNQATQVERAQSTAYYLTDRVAEFVRQRHILNNNAKLATIDKIRVNVNSSQVRCNASYQNNTITFGVAGSQGGQSCPNMAFSTVVEHEWGHGLDDVFGGIGNGGLAEGWADAVAQYYTGQPVIGKDFLGVGRDLRDGRNTRQYPSGITPHEQGETWMGGCWKFRVAMIQKLGAVLGKRRAETIVIGSIIADAKTQQAALRELYVLDDNDGNLNNGTPNCRELLAAFTTAHKIPSPVRSCSANPGAFTAFGQGCKGTGTAPAVCFSSNNSGGTLGIPPPPSTQLAYVVQPKTVTVLNGLQLFTRASSGSSQNVTVGLHRDNSGAPAATAAATLTLTVGSTAAWYQAKFGQPLTIKANEKVYLVHSGDQAVPALLTSGSAPTSPTLTRHPRFTQNLWVALPPGVSDRPAWRLECAGAGNNAVPRLDSSEVPEIGFPFTIRVGQASPNAAAWAFVGPSNTIWGSARLPFDLLPFGAAGCNVLTPSDQSFALRTNAQGDGTLTVSVPNQKSIVGLTLYAQAMVADPRANQLGLALTNGAAVKVGTR